MAILVERPPNFEQVLAAFPDAAKPGVIFAYGEDIYNPTGLDIPPALLKHEEVHQRRQAPDPAAWWDAYLTDPYFRYNEELLAHVAEYKAQITNTTDRNQRTKLLHSTARRLIAPLYGYDPPRELRDAVMGIQRKLEGC